MKNFFPLFALTSMTLVSGCVHLPTPASPNNVLSAQEHMTLGNAYLAQKEKALAIAQYQDALESDKSYVPALIALGNIAFEEKDYGKARGYFESARKIAPKDATVINNLAMVYLAEGRDLKEIGVMVEDALETAGSAKPYLWDTLANIAIAQGRYQDAENAINKAAETAPPQDPTFRTRLRETRDKLASAAKTTPRN